MDVDSEGAALDASDEEEEDIPLTTMTLVGEKDLERTSHHFVHFQRPPTNGPQRPDPNMPGYSPPTCTVSALHHSRYVSLARPYFPITNQTHSQDAGLICDPSAIVYKADEKDAPTSSIALGRVVGPDVRVSPRLQPLRSEDCMVMECPCCI